VKLDAETLYRFARLCELEAREAASEALLAATFYLDRRRAKAANERARHLRDLAFEARRRARTLPAGNLQS
jgi:hypothetical protein